MKWQILLSCCMEIIWSSYAVPYIFIIYEILFFHSVTIPKVEKQQIKHSIHIARILRLLWLHLLISEKGSCHSGLQLLPGERNWNTKVRAVSQVKVKGTMNRWIRAVFLSWTCHYCVKLHCTVVLLRSSDFEILPCV